GHSFAGLIILRMVYRASEHVSDQPFRAVRAAAGHHEFCWEWESRVGAAFQDPYALQARTAPDLSRLHHRLLGHASDDRRPFALRPRHDCLHFCRYRTGGTGSDRTLRRGIQTLPRACRDDRTNLGAARRELVRIFALNLTTKTLESFQ